MCLPDNHLDNLKIRRTLVSNTTEQTSNLIVSNNTRRGRNSPGLCPRRVRSREIEFRHRLFPFFHFFDCNQLKQQFGHEYEQQFELEFEFEQHFELEQFLLLRSAHARRRLWEPSNTMIVSNFHLGGPLFFKRFSEGFFSQKWCQMEPNMASQILKI